MERITTYLSKFLFFQPEIFGQYVDIWDILFIEEFFCQKPKINFQAVLQYHYFI